MKKNCHYATINTVWTCCFYVCTYRMDFLVLLYQLNIYLCSCMDLPWTLWHFCMDSRTYYGYFLHFCMVILKIFLELMDIPLQTFSVLVFMYGVSMNFLLLLDGFNKDVFSVFGWTYHELLSVLGRFWCFCMDL